MFWGVDLGGTKIEAVVLDEEYSVLCRQRRPTEAERGMGHIVAQIGRLLDDVSRQVGASPSRLGIGTPGTSDPQTGILTGSNTQAINNQPFHGALEQALSIGVSIENDANCFALAETKMGIVQRDFPEAQVVFGVIMGTGVGGGVVVAGQVLSGRHGSTGEWGHTFVDESGGDCYCGDRGCVERVISGPALEAFYQQRSGRSLPLAEIDVRARRGEYPAAVETLDRLVRFFGVGLSNVVNVLDPDVIVLGGGVCNLDVLYEEGVSALRAHVFNPRFAAPVVRPLLGDSAGVFGAALLCA